MDVREEGRDEWDGAQEEYPDTKTEPEVTPLAHCFRFTGLKNKEIKHKDLEQFLCPQGAEKQTTVNNLSVQLRLQKNAPMRHVSVCFVFTSMILSLSTDLKGRTD